MAEQFTDLEALDETLDGKYLIFSMDDELYGIEIRYVTEIIGMQPVTVVPEAPEYIRGIINLRGKIIPVMDVRLRFKKPEREYDEKTCVIVVDTSNHVYGLIVDSVSEVMDITKEDIVAMPSIQSSQNNYVKAIGKTGNRVRLLLDCIALIEEDVMTNVEEIIQETCEVNK